MGEDVNMKKPEMTERPNRIRQYPVGHSGPIIVNIRAMNNQLESKKIHNIIFNKFQHVSEIVQVNEHKLKVIFKEKENTHKNVLELRENEIAEMECGSQPLKSAREEANELPMLNELCEKYRVYIPAKYVECNGVISWPKNESVNEFVSFATGKFVNPHLEEIRILEAVRLMKKSESNENSNAINQLEPTGIVVITFEGTVRPNTVNMCNLLVPVKEYRIKKMFCEKCKRYNHTEKFCNNKELKMPENIKCIQCKSSEHVSGDLKCPKRKEMEKKAQKSARNERRKTVAEMLKDLDPQGTMPDELEDEVLVEPLMSAGRKRKNISKNSDKKSTYASVLKSPERKKKNLSETPQNTPPGFINPLAQENEIVVGIVDFIKTILNDMDMPPFAKGLVEKFVLPYINRIVTNITNSVMQKFNASPSWLNETTE
jgi:hypothetical protein